MNRGLITLVAVTTFALVGCSDETAVTAAPAPTTTIATAAPTDASVLPSSTVEEVSTTEPENPDSYFKSAAEACRDITDMYDGLDQLSDEPIDREQAVGELIDEMTDSAEWDATPTWQQQEILRGMTAAGQGNC